jgi:hypothetical protein
MALDFSRYLDVDVADIPKVLPSVPGGHFFATIQSWKGDERDYAKATGGPKTPVIELTFKFTGADEDVEETDQSTYMNKLATKDFDLSNGGQTILRNFAEDTLGLDVKGLHFRDVLDALKGQEVKVFNEPRPNPNVEGQYFTNIKKMFAAS